MKALAIIQHHSIDLMELHQFTSDKSDLKSLTGISGKDLDDLYTRQFHRAVQPDMQRAEQSPGT